jgi:hypothetical protein
MEGAKEKSIRASYAGPALPIYAKKRNLKIL